MHYKYISAVKKSVQSHADHISGLLHILGNFISNSVISVPCSGVINWHSQRSAERLTEKEQYILSARFNQDPLENFFGK